MICSTYPGINPLNVWKIETDVMMDLLEVARKEQNRIQKQIAEMGQ